MNKPYTKKVRNLALLFMATVLVSSCGISKPVRVGSLSELIDQEEYFDGVVVTVSACLFVTPHGIGLVDCDGNRETIIMVIAAPGREAKSAYKKMVGTAINSSSASNPVMSLDAIGRFDVHDSLPKYTFQVMSVNNIKEINNSDKGSE